MTFTSVMALASSSLLMSVTGGGLQPYEVRAIEASVASLFGDEAAALELDRAPPYTTRSSVHLIPAMPIGFAPADTELAMLDGDLLGAPLPVDHLRVLAVADRPQLDLDACAETLACEALQPLPVDEAQLTAATFAAF